MMRTEMGAVPGWGSVVRKGLSEEVTFKLRSEGKESSQATPLGKSVPGSGNRKDGGPEVGRGSACSRNSERASGAGAQGGWRVLQEETEVAGGGPDHAGSSGPRRGVWVSSKCKEEPWMILKQKKNTISFLITKTMNNKPPSIHVEIYNFQNTFIRLPHRSFMNPVSLEPRSPSYRCRNRGSET